MTSTRKQKLKASGPHRIFSFLSVPSLKSVVVFISVFASATLFAADSSRGLALFNDYIGPLLRERCYECHSHESGKAKGGLVLDTRSGWATGGEHGPAIIPGKPEASLLIRAVSYIDPDLQMPQKKQLSEDQISKLRDWIALGATDPRIVEVAASTNSARQDHWAFKPIHRPPIPVVKGKLAARVNNPIDAFLLSKLQQRGVQPAPPADRRSLLRRVTFDLTGLPPAPDEVHSFLDDRTPKAWARVVDRLLASPHYGERWGRHWLDVAGFAESSLFIGDQVRPGFWRYRDYVIRAFNSDKPYDRFITEQIAGDELFDWRNTEAFSPEQIDLLAATGFLRCPPDATDNQQITQQEKIYPAQQQAMEVSMKAVLGLSLNCVRCHNHKFDPISQEEYYGLIAIFQPAYDPEKWLPGIWSDPHPGPIRAIPILPKPARDRYIAQSRTWPAEEHQLREQVNGGLLRKWRDPELLKSIPTIEDSALREKLSGLLQKLAYQRNPDEEKLISTQADKLGLSSSALQSRFPEFSNALAAASARLEQIKKDGAKLPPVIWATFDVSTNPSPTHLLRRGEYEQPAQIVGPSVLQCVDPENRFQLSAPPCSATTGRRLALARWLTNRRHPLTARVIANRVWQYHFGAGLVSTPDDFGSRGARPANPELLDWLASELIDHGWSLKHLHLLILNSAAYQQSSTVRENHKPDTFLASFPKRRLEAELVRDSMLELSSQLDTRLFGESIPTQRLADGRNVVPDNNPGRNRRSVYISTRRTTVPTFLTVFDEPTMDTNWPRRNDSVIPQQALALMNGAFVLDCSQLFARRLLQHAGSFTDRLTRAFELAYGRPPDAQELTLFREFCGGNEADEKAWRTICHAIFSSNEFLYVD